jgi:uncharacterized protein involved in exopolysaccharide biosynthesis
MSARDDSEAQPLLDLRQTRELLQYAGASLRRHRWRILLMTLFTTALTLPAMVYLPRTYTTTARVTARRESIMPALAHPKRSLPFYADNPSHLAPEMSLREDHLRELIKRVDLTTKFTSRRPDLLRIKDSVLDFVLGPLTPAEFEKMLMGSIEKNVLVSTDKDVVTITGTWRDPDTAAELVDTIKDMFIDERRHLEVDPIKDTIKLLQDEVRTTTAGVDNAFAELRLLRQAEKSENARQARRLRSEIDTERVKILRREMDQKEAQRQEREEVTRVQALLVSKRRSITELETNRSRQTMELRSQLANLETRLGEKHPDRVALQQSLRSMQVPPWELADLKKQEESLSQDFARLGGKETLEMAQAALSAPPPPEARSASSELLGKASEDEDEAVLHKRTQLRMLIDQSQDLQERLLGARIEQRVAEDAFRFRYFVLRDAEPPKKADKPAPVMILLGGVFAGLFLGMLMALARDIRSGRVFHAWQLERQVGVPLLGEVEVL